VPRIIPGHSLLNSKPNNSLLLGLKNQRLPGTLFLKTLDSNRYLAIPEELLESVPGTDGSDGFR